MTAENARLDSFVELARALPLSKDGAIEAVVAACDDHDSSMQDIADCIGREPGLAAITLRQANSAHYGYGRRVDTLLDAAVVLGVQTVRSLAISAAVLRLLVLDRDGLSAHRRGILDHSICTGVAARTIARRANNTHPERAFVAGLVHELGTIALTRTAKGEYLQVIAACRSERRPFEAVEREVFGFDHAALGGRLSDVWGFPPSISDAIRWQHEPGRAELERPLAETLHVADWLAAETGHGLVPFARPAWPDSRAADALGLTRASVGELVAEIGSGLAGWSQIAA
jgi:HD-like signal output (HDOD) protein